MKTDTWFTSDTHWHHLNVIKFCNRPFSSLEEMNRVLIENWNKVVQPLDTIYHLGDFVWKNSRHTINITKKLHGKIIIIKGNHDRTKDLNKLKSMNLIVDWFEYYSVKINDVDVILHHVPMWTELPMICGHVHDKWLQQRLTLNVGVDVWNYTPVNINEVIKRLKI